MSDQSPPAAGWYPDPAGPGSRYWDGGRWTEHTQPVPGAQPAQPLQPLAPTASGPGYGTHPAAPASTAVARSTAILDQLKRGEGAALVLLGAVLVALSTVLPWATYSLTSPGVPEISDSSTAWASDAPWLIRGYDVDEFWTALRQAELGQPSSAPSGGTDLVLLLPLLAGAAGLVFASQQGKRVTRGAEIVMGCCALLLILLVLEIVHLGSWMSDLQKLIVQNGGAGSVSGGAGFGLWLATAAAAVMTFGAIQSLRSGRSR
jgi:Protein of unknown function (DUF2510)